MKTTPASLYSTRVAQLENEGCTTSDAQAVADCETAEQMRTALAASTQTAQTPVAPAHTIKLQSTAIHTRTLFAVGLIDEIGRIEISINFTGLSTCAKAIPLDHEVIPAIVHCVNTHAALVAENTALREALLAFYNLQPFPYAGCQAVILNDDVVSQARHALSRPQA